MEIQVIIPWGKNGNLGAAYNRLMDNVEDWVCFLDHDVLMLNPNWYHMCLNAIARVGDRAGWITGVTNAIANPYQLQSGAPKSDKILNHMEYAKQLYDKYGEKLVLVDSQPPHFFSGFMILTHKKVWQDVAGFIDGFLGVDNEYHKALLRCGYQAYVMPGLYMYHLYHSKKKWGQF